MILQALLDSAGHSKSINPSWPDWKHKRVKKEALDWLLHDNEDFPMVCVYATVPEVTVRKLAKKIARGDSNAKKLLIEWRDIFSKQIKETKNGVEV